MATGQQNLNSLPTQTLAEGGYIMTLQKPGTDVEIKQLPMADVSSKLDLADTALQPTDVSDMAFEDPASFVTQVEHQAIIAEQAAQIAVMQSQIDQLFSIVGVGAIIVFEPDVFEEGVFVS